MGTNYYIINDPPKDPRKEQPLPVHIGKTSFMGQNKIMFTWAVEQKGFYKRFATNGLELGGLLSMNVKVIEDEYGHMYSLTEFTNLIKKCVEHDISLVGKEFS